jgi:hypothetical protein
MQLQFSSRAAVVKIYDGKAWSIRGLINNNKQWDGFIREIRSEKSYYSHGFCCYNEKFVNGFEIEGEDKNGRYVINNASPNGKSQIFQIYWRPYRMQEIQNEPGFSQAASKNLSMRMHDFINNIHKMEYVTERSLEACAGKYYGIPGTDCTTRYELQHSIKYNAPDQSKSTSTTNYEVFLNRKGFTPTSDLWTTILDTGGYLIALPNSAIQEFNSTQGTIYRGNRNLDYNHKISLIAFGLKRYECSIFDKKLCKNKHSIKLETIFNRCGDLCDSYRENLIINDSIRILIGGFDK